MAKRSAVSGSADSVSHHFNRADVDPFCSAFLFSFEFAFHPRFFSWGFWAERLAWFWNYNDSTDMFLIITHIRIKQRLPSEKKSNW